MICWPSPEVGSGGSSTGAGAGAAAGWAGAAGCAAEAAAGAAGTGAGAGAGLGWAVGAGAEAGAWANAEVVAMAETAATARARRMKVPRDAGRRGEAASPVFYANTRLLQVFGVREAGMWARKRKKAGVKPAFQRSTISIGGVRPPRRRARPGWSGLPA
ncbi:hypothetical protein C5708_14020 [Caulobacter sp. CCUG 60055]|nr:hypothetical protein [Caulobacter sp. CCUG 60055]